MFLRIAYQSVASYLVMCAGELNEVNVTMLCVVSAMLCCIVLSLSLHQLYD